MLHPTYFTLADDVESLNYIFANNKVYEFNPTVKDMMKIIFANENDDYELMMKVLNNYGLWFYSPEEFANFYKGIWIDKTRFGTYRSNHTGKVTFDWLVDSTLVISDLLRSYPQIFKSISDIQNMDWWTFEILFDGLGNSINDRVSIRSQKPKGDNHAEINSAKQKVRISENFKRNPLIKR